MEKRYPSQSHSKAGYYCCVPHCNNRSSGDPTHPAPTLSFHRFPSCTKRRKAWVRAIRRDEGPDFSITSNTRVCSAHFTASDFRPPSGGRCRGEERRVARLTGDAVPSMFDWTKNSKPRKSSVERAARKDVLPCQLVGPMTPSDSRTAKSTPNVDAVDNQVDDVDPAKIVTPPPYLDHDYVVPSSMLSSQAAATCMRQMAALRAESDDLRRFSESLFQKSITLDSLRDDPEKFKHFTGLTNYGVFCALVRYLTPKAKHLRWWRGESTLVTICQPDAEGRSRLARREHKLSIEEQFFLVLVRLRTGASTLEMAHRAGISTSYFSKLYTTWINFLDYELGRLHSFPTGHPRCYVPAFSRFPLTRIVVDCTEVYTKRPSGLMNRKQLFSSYKHHNTVKFLVGVAASGAVIFVSNMWGGRASDQQITRECGLLNLLQPGHHVMADRGFTVAEELADRGVTLHVPSFRGSHRSQLSSTEVTSSRRIAEARIHVERAIERIKEFRLLCGEVDISVLHTLEQSFRVCAFLTNFQPPIVKEIVYKA